MTVLTPASNPQHLLTQSPTSQSQQTIIQRLSPALTNSLYLASIFHQLISTTTLFLLLRIYFLVQQTYYFSAVFLLQSLYASKIAFWASSLVGKGGLWTMGKGWKAIEPVRQKCFREFMIFILGPGNPMLMMVFWPGWILVGPTVFGVWYCCF